MKRSVRLTEADNGWILEIDNTVPSIEVYQTLDEVFTRLLSYCEWRNERGSTADRYGVVTIERRRPCDRQADG